MTNEIIIPVSQEEIEKASFPGFYELSILLFWAGHLEELVEHFLPAMVSASLYTAGFKHGLSRWSLGLTSLKIRVLKTPLLVAWLAKEYRVPDATDAETRDHVRARFPNIR